MNKLVKSFALMLKKENEIFNRTHFSSVNANEQHLWKLC